MKRLLFICILLIACAVAYGQPTNIWEGTSLKSKSVTLTPYLPESEHPVPAVIVCPGGSYFWLGRKKEGTMVAEWLSSNGIAAFVLEYRTGGWFDFTFRSRRVFRGNQFPDMIQDLQRSIEIVRSDHEKYCIDPDCVGTMGFSAGGHLVMSSAELFNTDFLALAGVVARASVRPDFVAPIYPVVSMTAPCTHLRSRRGLLGERRQNDPAMRDSLSLELHVRPDTPPVFLLNCVDDPVVDYHNSELLDSALTAEGIPHKYIQYKEGGHGFGACPENFSAETALWQNAFLDWFNENIRK